MSKFLNLALYWPSKVRPVGMIAVKICSTTETTGCFIPKKYQALVFYDSRDLKIFKLRHSCTISTDYINSTSEDSDMVVQRLPWLEKNGKNSLKMLSMDCVWPIPKNN